MRKIQLKAALATAIAVLCAASAAQASSRIVVSPEPNTPDASPQTEISFLGASASDLGSVTVVASRSGAHSGRLVAYSSQRGVSFVPDRAFVSGDRVSVRAPRAGLRFSFTVVGGSPVRGGEQVSAAQVNRGGVWSFQSNPFHPPSVRVTVNSSAADSGDIFVAPIRAPSTTPGSFVGQPGPLIYDRNGQPVWFAPTPNIHTWAMNFHPQVYNGQPVLTWWQGHVNGQGIGSGQDIIADSSYRTIATISNANGWIPDLHEFLITRQGTAFITSYRAIRKDISAYHGPHNGQLWDSIVQEVDLATGRVMFEWHPLAHISLHETFTTPVSGMVWDPYHVNSVDIDRAGNLLISARNTWGVYYVRHSDGKILWRLGGNRNNFRFGRGTRFAWQHDARFVSPNAISIFDDEATPQVGPRSRGIIIKFDTRRRTASLLHEYRHSNTLAGSQGNMQVLPDGHAFEGWGAAPFFSEYTRGGRLLYDAHFHGADESYRAFRAPWVGRPDYPPSLAVSGGTAYASWNGATEVASWRLLAGPDPSHLAPAGSSGRQGFETQINSSSSGPYFAVQALAANGAVLGTSATVHS
jgi:hypothetical protein